MALRDSTVMSYFIPDGSNLWFVSFFPFSLAKGMSTFSIFSINQLFCFNDFPFFCLFWAYHVIPFLIS